VKGGSRVIVALALAAALPRCATDPTGVFVRVTVDPAIRTFAGAAHIRVFDADAMLGLPPVAMGSLVSVPNQSVYSFFVEKKAATRRVRIEVEAFSLTSRPEDQRPMSGEILDRAVVTYVTDQVVEVDLRLQPACRTSLPGTMCMPTEHCVVTMVGPVPMGQCVLATVTNPTRHNW